MADNYLEKKFEEHLNAPSKGFKRHIVRPQHRAMVLGNADDMATSIVRALRVAGHKVLFVCPSESGRDIALHSGADFFAAEWRDFADGMVLSEKVMLWGGVQIVVVCFEASVELSHFLLSHCSFYADLMDRADTVAYGRFVLVVSGTENQAMAVRKMSEALMSFVRNRQNGADRKGYTINVVSYISCVARGSSANDVSRLLRFLIDDDNGFLSGQNIVLDGGIVL